MKISETFSGCYFKAADFPTPRNLVIESVMKVTFDEGPKPAVRFQGERQQLVLNKTNAFTLANAFGDDTDLWSGKHIQIFAVPTFFQGKQVKGLCIQPLTQPGNGNEPVPTVVPSPPPIMQPAAQQIPENQFSASQQSTPQTEASFHPPTIDYEE
tara:strand:+ start:42 stop:506 length:465 start_codon:yes stop_codon:yes gene_type:complete